MAWIDPMHIRTAIVNLLRNALAFAEQGTKVEIEVDGSGDMVMLSVKNVGPEIPPDERELIFAQDLERHGPGGELVASAIYPAHTTHAHELLDAIGRDQMAGTQWSGWELMVRSGRDLYLRADHDRCTGSTPRASAARCDLALCAGATSCAICP